MRNKVWMRGREGKWALMEGRKDIMRVGRVAKRLMGDWVRLLGTQDKEI